MTKTGEIRRTDRLWGWLVGSGLCVAAALVTYVYGVQQTLTLATDVDERCTAILGQPYDPTYGARSWWPISRRCNASFDMVSSWVTPAVVVLAGLGVVMALVWVRGTVRRSADAAV